MTEELLRGQLLDLMEACDPEPIPESRLVALTEQSATRVRWALEYLEDTGAAVRSHSAAGDQWCRNI